MSRRRSRSAAMPVERSSANKASSGRLAVSRVVETRDQDSLEALIDRKSQSLGQPACGQRECELRRPRAAVAPTRSRSAASGCAGLDGGRGGARWRWTSEPRRWHPERCGGRGRRWAAAGWLRALGPFLQTRRSPLWRALAKRPPSSPAGGGLAEPLVLRGCDAGSPTTTAAPGS